MADIAIDRPVGAAETRSAWTQLSTSKNWLGFWFMVPAAAFLILFLAYPLAHAALRGEWAPARWPGRR